MGTINSSGIHKKWQKAEDNSVQEKSGAGFTTMLTLNVKPLAAGKYRFAFSGEARVKAGGGLTSQPKFRVKVDGAVKAIRTMPADLEWGGTSGWDFQAFNQDDAPVIILEMQRFGGTETIEVSRLKLSIELMEE